MVSSKYISSLIFSFLTRLPNKSETMTKMASMATEVSHSCFHEDISASSFMMTVSQIKSIRFILTRVTSRILTMPKMVVSFFLTGITVFFSLLSSSMFIVSFPKPRKNCISMLFSYMYVLVNDESSAHLSISKSGYMLDASSDDFETLV